MGWFFNKFLLFCFVFFSLTSVYSENDEISKNYLRRALVTVDTDVRLANDFLNKAGDYSKNFPEYYYGRYLIHRKNNDASKNVFFAEKMLETVSQGFIVSVFDVYRTAALIYTEQRDFQNALDVYRKVFANNQGVTLNDSNNYLIMLFNGDVTNDIPEAIENAQKLMSGSNLTYFKALYSLRFNNLTWGNPQLLINTLKSDNYSPEKIAYLESYTAKTEDAIITLLNLLQNSSFSKEYTKNTAYNCMKFNEDLSLDNFERSIRIYLASEGNRDFRTIGLIENSLFKTLCETKADVSSDVLHYTGERISDTDSNGSAEIVYTFKEGVIIKKIYDPNQDGLFEFVYDYQDDGRINSITRRNTDGSTIKYLYNLNDSSLNFVYYYENDVKKSGFIIETGKVSFVEGVIPDEEFLKKVCINEELYTNGVTRNKYYNGDLVYSTIDRDKNGYFEYKQIFENGILIEGHLDTKSNGTYDTLEVYDNGVMKAVYCKSVPYYSGYDYKELFFTDRTEKFWDDDFNSSFELNVIARKNGVTETYFDFNNDSLYDFMQSKDSKGIVKVFSISNDKRVEYYTILPEKKSELIGFNVVSAKIPANLIIPESINFINTSVGTFYYKNVKYHFSDGIIITDDFTYRVMKNRFGVFLFDY